MTGLNVNWEQIGEILVLLFVISVVFETALTPIFNWRLFARFCEGKGVKTPLTVIAAVALLWNYDIDIFRHIIDAFASDGKATGEATFLGRIITGLLVAGGSGAIFNIFAKIGLRNPKELARKAEKTREAAEEAKKAREAAEKAEEEREAAEKARKAREEAERRQGREAGADPPANG